LKPREALDLIGFEWPRLGLSERLRRCYNVEDLRRLAARRTPRPVFDYVDGGADGELTLRRNREAFEAYELMPVGPADVSKVDPRVSLFGRRIALPLMCSPTGYTRMMHPDGELGVARAAGAAGIPFGLSTVASTSVEDLVRSGNPDLWFQLYIWRDRELVKELVRRAQTAGYRVLEVAVDIPVGGFRTRDVRNGLSIPPHLTPRTLGQITLKPSYWWNVLRNPPLTFANAPQYVKNSGDVTIEYMTSQLDPTIGWDDVAAIRELWSGPLLVKGWLSPKGAAAAIAAGADGVHLSNHGGRQLDRVVPPLEQLGAVRAELGEEATIVLDSGIRHGTDLAIAIALGADAGAVGRAYLYGLMAGGEAGVGRVLALLEAEFRRAMTLLGVSSVAELRARGPELLRRRPLR